MRAMRAIFMTGSLAKPGASFMPLGAISISYSSASYTMREISSMREFAFASSRLVSTTMT